MRRLLILGLPLAAVFTAAPAYAASGGVGGSTTGTPAHAAAGVSVTSGDVRLSPPDLRPAATAARRAAAGAVTRASARARAATPATPHPPAPNAAVEVRVGS